MRSTEHSIKALENLINNYQLQFFNLFIDVRPREVKARMVKAWDTVEVTGETTQAALSALCTALGLGDEGKK